ncbi:radical SAM protein [Petroclostridium sp. X23]|uniref:radical SAM/SPASM domain-containing protein n=1 Tax=Petroclostridium sp. X23 TaxID=3045146 RepID=UPI0024AC931D|nr:radical SAM protein [Petroclostridium sp. X23]WHH59479.1 radical SAM protein [Petroclostridium sp. X23]
MIEITNITGNNKILFNLKLKISVLFHFIPYILKRKLSLKNFILFLRRLLIFLSRMQHNKFVRIGDKTRLDLYVPGFPSKAFYTACKKFMHFDGAMPCATVLISVTSACTNRCSHCYQKLDKGKDVNIDTLVNAAQVLQERGVAFYNIEGGEPFLAYDRLKNLCSSIDERSEIWINSTGVGMTIEKLKELRKLNVTAVMFSLHSPQPEDLNRFMGNDSAWDTLQKAVEMCHDADIAVAFNTCLMREDFYNGTFEEIMDTAKDFHACMIQLIKPKPSGAWLEKEDILFDEKDIALVKEKVNKYNTQQEFARYPSISAQIIEEDAAVFGCTAGGIDRFYINAKGDVQPCEFLNISFGNIADQPFEMIYEKMRNVFSWGGNCYLCEKYSKEIHHQYKENHLKTLPLPPEISEKIYGTWDRGDKTDLYKSLEQLK